VRRRQREEKRRKTEPSVLRGVADELGITTPKEAQRRRRKDRRRVKVISRS
jgi:hypothetical protein